MHICIFLGTRFIAFIQFSWKLKNSYFACSKSFFPPYFNDQMMYVFHWKCFKWFLGFRYNINNVIEIMLIIDNIKRLSSGSRLISKRVLVLFHICTSQSSQIRPETLVMNCRTCSSASLAFVRVDLGLGFLIA